MKPETIKIVQECTEASDRERITFPEVVMKLSQAGVERYHADLLRGDRVFYMPSGESHRVQAEEVGENPAMAFAAGEVEAAIRAIQQQKIQYREFCDRIVRAGCVGYIVSLTGRRAVYYGRSGDSYVEPFPKAA
jgi:uncharacterized protein YbcV (DUF1398 family)